MGTLASTTELAIPAEEIAGEEVKIQLCLEEEDVEDVQDLVIPPSKESLKTQMREDMLKEPLAFFYLLTNIWPNSIVLFAYSKQILES